MKIVFVTTCKNRAAHLARTLPKNLEDNPRSTFLVLDYGSQDDLTSVLMPYRDFKYGRLVVYHYPTDGPFRMAHAKNMAHRLGILEGADVLVNLDADNYLGAGFEDFVAERFESDTFLWSGLVQGLGRKMRGVSGRIAVTPQAFLKAGGYDEKKYDTWGPDDKDFNARLCHLGYRPVQIDRNYLAAIPHGDGVRFKEYPEARENALGEEAELPPPETAVANFGKFGMGEVLGPGGALQLGPIPTRIFGIGLHKTATSSLHAALQILGYESAHWESGAWAKSVWDEVRAGGIAPTLEKFYAASDLPISILYKELDRAYPGSKFILTIRNEAEWLRSVRDHFSYKNPFRWEWDVYPFSNVIHQAIYGRKTFDYHTFRARYRWHNAEVIEHFKNRPDDLLVMRTPAWTDLCRFLGNPVPSVDYPRKFVTNGG